MVSFRRNVAIAPSFSHAKCGLRKDDCAQRSKLTINLDIGLDIGERTRPWPLPGGRGAIWRKEKRLRIRRNQTFPYVLLNSPPSFALNAQSCGKV